MTIVTYEYTDSKPWSDFVRSADLWTISYYYPPQTFVKFFMIGHALELYLKAVYAMKSGSNSKAIRRGHKIWDLWQDCKGYDSNFMRDITLSEFIYQRPLNARGADREKWHRELDERGLLDHFETHAQMYTVMWHLADLKYAYAPPKDEGKEFGGPVWANSYWTAIVKELRNYLGYPGHGVVDFIDSHLKHAETPGSDTVRDAWVKAAIRELSDINSS